MNISRYLTILKIVSYLTLRENGSGSLVVYTKGRFELVGLGIGDRERERGVK